MPSTIQVGKNMAQLDAVFNLINRTYIAHLIDEGTQVLVGNNYLVHSDVANSSAGLLQVTTSGVSTLFATNSSPTLATKSHVSQIDSFPVNGGKARVSRSLHRACRTAFRCSGMRVLQGRLGWGRYPLRRHPHPNFPPQLRGQEPDRYS